MIVGDFEVMNDPILDNPIFEVEVFFRGFGMIFKLQNVVDFALTKNKVIAGT